MEHGMAMVGRHGGGEIRIGLLGWAWVGLMGAGLVYASVNGGRALIAVGRLKRSLARTPAPDATIQGMRGISRTRGEVFFVEEFAGNALTAGFIRPQVFVSQALVRLLDEQELQAVVLHETHHVENRDPLRMFVASFIRDFLFFLPAARSLARRFSDSREKAADDAAAEKLQDPSALASALVKVVEARGSCLTPHFFARTGQELSPEGRIERLLEPAKDVSPTISKLTVVSSVLLVGALLASLAFAAASGGHAMVD
jgi:Zn-dependent protease with chaperone function